MTRHLLTHHLSTLLVTRAVYVEASEHASLYLTSLKNYNLKYSRKRKIDTWGMKEKNLINYQEDPNVRNLEIEFKFNNWFNK